MIIYKKVAVGIVSVILLSSFALINDWFSFENENCKISFPKEPSADSTSTQTAIGELTVYYHMYQPSADENDSNMIYGLFETKYPEKYFEASSPAFVKGVFDGAVNAAAKKVNGKILSDKEITLNSYPGREIKVDYGNGQAIITIRMYLKKNRVFATQTIALTANDNNQPALQFLNSLEIK